MPIIEFGHKDVETTPEVDDLEVDVLAGVVADSRTTRNTIQSRTLEIAKIVVNLDMRKENAKSQRWRNKFGTYRLSSLN